MTEALHRGFYEDFLESGENFGAWFWMGYEESAARYPAISFVEFSLVLGFFEFLVVAVQDLDVEFVCSSEVVQDSGNYGFIIVFANAETVLSITQVSINPAKMGCVERIDCHCFLDKIEFVATNDVRFRARAIVSCWPVGCAVFFDFFKELVGPEVF
jgi:hypothetical protein